MHGCHSHPCAAKHDICSKAAVQQVAGMLISFTCMCEGCIIWWGVGRVPEVRQHSHTSCLWRRVATRGVTSPLSPHWCGFICKQAC
jgi:hypothetical protein